MAALQNGSTPSNDLNSADYSPIAHLNTIFAHSSTLSSARDVSIALSHHEDDVDMSISERVARQAESNASSIQRLKDAQKELAALFERIETVQKRALETEQSITLMTADIKRLDQTKRNLTLSMTALKRLQMLTTAYEQLRTLGKSRQYRECGQLLGAVVQLMAHFKGYRSIEQIAVLSRKVSDVQREMLEQVCEDFENAWQKNEVLQQRAMLHEACNVIEALGDGARMRLMMWYCNVTLKEYRHIFRGNEEAGSLDNISRRFAWFNRIMKTYETDHAAVFPQQWRVNEVLANAFCESTKDDFSGILQKSARRADGQTIDVNLLLSCLQETLDFEHTLERRFMADSRRSIDTVSSITSSDDKRQSFTAAISSAFEPYLGLWVEAQDRTLSQMIPKYRSTPVHAGEDFNAELVMPSSTELFQFYRVCLAQCAKLSTGEQLSELAKLFGKYLDQYSQDVLFHTLADRAGTQGPSIQDIVVILNTADYCYMTTSQLEEKIKARIDTDFAAAIDLEPQAEAFLGVAGAAVRALVHSVEQECETAWREMRNVPWAKMESVGDQSSYIGFLVNSIRRQSKSVLEILKKQQYVRAFCDNLVDAITTTYISNVVASRPVSEVGAEQLLLDSYIVKNALIGLPTLVADSQAIPASTTNYSKRVAQTMSRIDSLLKTIQVRPSPPEALVQAYLLHISDRSESNFKKILDLKGITARRDQAPLMELFNAHKVAPHHAQLPSAGIILTHLNFATPVSGSHASTPSLSNPSTAAGSVVGGAATSFGTNVAAATGGFGNVLLSAAKDGALSLSNASSVAPSRVASPPGAGGQGAPGQGQALPRIDSATPPSADLSGNLKNIGRFFKRDMGNAFGRFGSG